MIASTTPEKKTTFFDSDNPAIF